MQRQALQRDDLLQLLLAMADDVIGQSTALGDLDARIGDGDLGVTLTLGFQAVKAALADAQDSNLQGVLSKCAMAFADNASSTFGTLTAAMFMGAAGAAKDKDALGPGEVAAMLRSAVAAVQRRGKAQRGDKTVLDALIPAAEACEEAAGKGASLADCMQAALAAAKRGADETVGMHGRAGRSAWLGERTVGVKDPGAAAFVSMLESAARFVPGGMPA